ncbi:MAG: tRNA (N6-isopentenyl adenosine(37)-C2)-methylthiotransferase MiaB [Clostridiales bacterium]|nr:tRNA (N6-isopentenyl adenosine(37)-C2)-methylthiotransferase MiaB [Clostridiales bacterium]MCF8023260.1 tRNA (N6-isopentenyl adenosine(37)-C2)-methylthiotransferase MiaB [Clostridiales bacterium]
MTASEQSFDIPEHCRGIGEGKFVFVYTFGCQMNEHDSEVVVLLLGKMGYTKTEDSTAADVIVINTCCVRETAENKIFGLLGRLRKLKNKNPNLIIAVGGCMVQQEGMGKRVKDRFHHVDIVYGTHNLSRLPELITEVSSSRKRVLEVWPNTPEQFDEIPERKVSGVHAWVCIMHGCNNYCTYCIVPYVRGRERSRLPLEINDEVRNLVSQGIKEITLLGQNVNSYGKDLEKNIDFADLIMMLEEIKGLERIRFMTSHPKDISDKLIDSMSRSKKVCEHIHLPVQAGSNAVLKAMNRGYTREKYIALAEKIKSVIPGVSLTTDIIVGFPGETEEDFKETLEMVKRINFDSAFMFIYNKRSGTPAAKMKNQVSNDIKSRRIQELIQVQNDITIKSNESEVGKIFEVLVEGKSKTRKDRLSGHTRTNKIVVFYGSDELIGMPVSVEITSYSLTHLEGKALYN